jgi:hypothetical protein
MLDPLSALSLASSVVQFIDFGCKLVSEGCELYKKGASGKNDGLEQVTKDLARVTDGLTKRGVPPAAKYSEDELVLQELAGSCKLIADELLGILEELKPQKSQNGLESFRKALRSARKKGKIQDVGHRLDKLQNQLSFRLIAILK